MNHRLNRRRFVQATSLALAGKYFGTARAEQQPTVGGLRILHPLGRIPLSFVIDDSTCLVNMGHFCMPQFAEAWPDRAIYKQAWHAWPREIPDAFVREFGEWCAQHDVKGKYSIVPYPACVGWLDRGLPGWSKQDLEASLQLVRELMVPNWDIHPEMITHTRVIDLKTGRPMASANAATMENSYPQQDVSVDYLADYMAYALRILKNCGLPCEGITTPGGFGNRVKAKLPVAVHQAVRDVFGTELPHYFKYVVSGDESTRPKLEFTNSSNSVESLTMNVPAGTGDWFGGWEGSQQSEGHRYASDDATQGRMVELIERGDPAVMLCHWPGLYCNGQKSGFEDFKRIVMALANRFGDETIWMKLSEIGRYQAAMELTQVSQSASNRIQFDAPLSCPKFTIELNQPPPAAALVQKQDARQNLLKRVTSRDRLAANSYYVEREKLVVAMDLPSGLSELVLRDV